MQAAGFYNTLFQSDDAALVIEVLNGYWKREPVPVNIGEYTLPLGVPEVIRPGSDVTLVTYGACCDIALDAARSLERVGIDLEIVDVRTLLPFDLPGVILESLKKTNRIVFMDEDYPGGGTAYMMREALEVQGGFQWLDTAPRTLSAPAHRPAYGSDGDYFSKPNREQVVEVVYALMREQDPEAVPRVPLIRRLPGGVRSAARYSDREIRGGTFSPPIHASPLFHQSPIRRRMPKVHSRRNCPTKSRSRNR